MNNLFITLKLIPFFIKGKWEALKYRFSQEWWINAECNEKELRHYIGNLPDSEFKNKFRIIYRQITNYLYCPSLNMGIGPHFGKCIIPKYSHIKLGEFLKAYNLSIHDRDFNCRHWEECFSD